MKTDPKAQAEQLMNDLLCVAEKLLQEHGEFHPFGGYLLDDGTITQLGLSMPHGASVAGVERARQVETALRSVAVSVKPLVVGIVKNVLIPSPLGEEYDAVEIDLEHRQGYSAEVFFGYRLPSSDLPTLEFTTTTAQAGPVGRFFGVAGVTH
jgi:hypothetical protein